MVSNRQTVEMLDLIWIVWWHLAPTQLDVKTSSVKCCFLILLSSLCRCRFEIQTRFPMIWQIGFSRKVFYWKVNEIKKEKKNERVFHVNGLSSLFKQSVPAALVPFWKTGKLFYQFRVRSKQRVKGNTWL